MPFLKRIFRSIGPGFITGAADDDPSGILTYSQTGALFGLGQLWTALFSFPFMAIIQEMCGRIGLVTGKGLASVIKKHYSKYLLAAVVLSLVIVNTINIGADLGAMAASLELMTGVQPLIMLVLVAGLIVFVEVAVPYPAYVKFLKYLSLSLLAYLLTAFIVTNNWALVLKSTLIPHIEFSRAYLFNIAAILGTTISPYLFFWQADEEVEERNLLKGNVPSIKKMRMDTGFGMFFSNLITFFIILTVAETLGASGIKNIDSLSQVAEALRPLAGNLTFFIFSLGILGTGLLAVPVLAGSAAYALSQSLGWRSGLGKPFGRARGFYGIIICSTFVGLAINFLAISPVKMLYYTAILNGIMSPPIMALVILISNDKKIMGERTNPTVSNIAGWFITAVMFVISLLFCYLLFT